MFIAMLGHEDFEKTDFSHMRTGIMAGSPCPIKVMQDVIDKNAHDGNLHHLRPDRGFSRLHHEQDHRLLGSPGEHRSAAMFGVECKIVDPETNEDLPDNVDGEFVAKGYNIMKGYYKMPEAPPRPSMKTAGFTPASLARRDENGYYKITGRIKDMIIRGGENIYPKEIEDFIYTHPKVSDVQVIGVPDKQYGEEIMACVVLKPGEA